MRKAIPVIGRLQTAAICLLLLHLLPPAPCLAAGPPPVITVQPLSQFAQLLDRVTFSVNASSGTTLSYQWLKNSANIVGATTSSYTIASVLATDAGTYAVRVSNAGGSVTSSNATLTVLVPPGITTQPHDQTVAQGQNPSFSVVATGTTPLSYQWYFNGTAISGATNSLCTVSNAQPANAGNYTLGITNAAGTVISSNAVLTVVNPIILMDNISSASTNAATLTWSHTVGNGANTLLLLEVAVNGGTVSSVTYGGRALTLVGSVVQAMVDTELWSLTVPTPGKANVVVTASGGTKAMVAGATSYVGVSRITPLGTPVTAAGTGARPSATVASAAGELVFAAAGVHQGTTSTVGSGQSQLWQMTSGTGASAIWGATSTELGAAAVTMNWSVNTSGGGGEWGEVAVAIKPVPALQADVRTTQTGPTNATAGANYTCIIVATNAGPNNATNIILTEILPAGVAFFSASGGSGSNNGAATWPAFNLASGSSTNFTLTLTAPAVGTLTNTVSSTADTYDPDESDNDGSAGGANVVTTVTPLGSPGLVSTASVTATNVATMSWSHTVGTGANRLLLVGFSFGDNTKAVTSVTCGGTSLSFVGRSAVNRGLELWRLVNPAVGTANIVANWSGNKDTVLWSAAFTNVDQISPLGSFQSTSGQSTTPSLNVASATGDLVVDVLAATGDAGTLTPDASQTMISTGNTGAAGGNARGGGSYKAGASSVTMSWTLGASKSWDLGAVTLNAATPVQADVTATQDGATGVYATSNLTYTITVTNAGPATATNLVVSDTLPTGSVLVSASGGGANTNGVVMWTISLLPYAATTNFTVTVTAPTSGTLTNTVFSTAATSDPDASNNNGTAAAASVVTTVTPLADIATTATGPANVLAAANFSYTVLVTNRGPSAAANVLVSNTLPAGVVFVSASGGGSVIGGVVTWPPLVSLANGAGTAFTVTVTAPVSGTLTNTVASNASTSDPYASNNDGTSAAATVVTLVCTPPTITAQPQPQSQAVTVGQDALFSVVATGTPSLSYQWWFNGAPLTGATSSALPLSNVQTSNAGSYTVVVTNVAGSVTSAGATLTVTNPAPPTIGAQAMTTNGFTFQLSVSVGQTYVILATTNLQDWTPISTNVFLTGDAVITDPTATNYTRRFYRVMVQ